MGGTGREMSNGYTERLGSGQVTRDESERLFKRVPSLSREGQRNDNTWARVSNLQVCL